MSQSIMPQIVVRSPRKTASEEEGNKVTKNQIENNWLKGTSKSWPTIITLNVNDLNSQVKNQSDWMDEKQDSTISCLKENHFSFKDMQRVKVKGKG